jgi:hypothetical protein
VKKFDILCIHAFVIGLVVLVAAPSAIGAEKPQPREFRLPLIRTPADVEASPNLSAAEKSLALENIRRGTSIATGGRSWFWCVRGLPV